MNGYINQIDAFVHFECKYMYAKCGKKNNSYGISLKEERGDTGKLNCLMKRWHVISVPCSVHRCIFTLHDDVGLP